MPDLLNELSQHAMKEPSVPRYFFDTDNDGHNYLVPCARQTEWLAWKAAWEAHYEGTPSPPVEPPGAMLIDATSTWTFAFPKENRFS